MLHKDQQSTKSVYAFGFNHKNSDVALREKIAFSDEQINQIIAIAQKQLNCDELVLVSTCNRVEFYAVANQKPDFIDWLLKFIPDLAGDYNQLIENAFNYHNREAVMHLYRVACGLNSLVLGETQILGQLKNAYQTAKQQNTINSVLDRLFQQSFSIAKQVRSNTAIGENPISIAYAGVKVTRHFFDDLPKRTAMIIGAGNTGKLVARYLKSSQIKRLIIANRTIEKAQKLAEETGGYAINLNQINDHIHEADLIFGTAYLTTPILSKQIIQKVSKKRGGKIQVLIDLGMPRNFDFNIDQINNCFLYGINDLEQVVDDNKQTRQKAAIKAEQIIKLYCDDFLGWLHSKPKQQLVRQIRDNAEQTRAHLVQEAHHRLALGDDPATVLEELGYKLTRKLIHSPSALIQAIPPDHKDWLAIVADIFNKSK